MKVKLLIHWNGNEIGTELTLDAPVAELLIERGAAVRIETQKVQPTEIKKGK